MAQHIDEEGKLRIEIFTISPDVSIENDESFREGAKWMRDKILNKGGESSTVKNK